MTIQKNPFFWLLTIYTTLMLYKTPTISDSLIVISIASILIFQKYFLSKKELNSLGRPDDELSNLQRELEKERLKMTINQIKFESSRQQAMQDEKNAGGTDGRKYVF